MKRFIFYFARKLLFPPSPPPCGHPLVRARRTDTRNRGEGDAHERGSGSQTTFEAADDGNGGFDARRQGLGMAG